MMWWLFLSTVALLAYAWVAYPVILRLLAGAARSKVDPQPGPRLKAAVIVSAYNEEAHIRERIRNLRDVDWPSDSLTVWIGVDGASDRTGTEAEAEAGGDARVRVRQFEKNRGKVAVLKDLVRECAASESPDILVFTDANTVFERGALKRLLAPFADCSVGGVCGRLSLVRGGLAETHEGTYWDWEARLKDLESRLDSCLGANGAIYAMRAGLFWRDIPDNTIVDDFVLGMKVRETGARMVFEPDAVAYEEMPATVGDEWTRRVRIGAGDYQALWLCRRALLPRYGVFAWMFMSHKFLRWFTPHLMLLATASAAVHALKGADGSGLAVAVLWLSGMAVLALLAAVSRLTVRLGLRLPGLLERAAYFFTIQAALAAGFLRFCGGDLRGSWRRTSRGTKR
ncbi:MAG: glycosyltransferase family 2 protein [Planctomycetes bacterium]|nr:glycosyltransferase family 2 protein [Planctomycetota bacterium]